MLSRAWPVHYEPRTRSAHFSARPRVGLGIAISISPGLVPSRPPQVLESARLRLYNLRVNLLTS